MIPFLFFLAALALWLWLIGDRAKRDQTRILADWVEISAARRGISVSEFADCISVSDEVMLELERRHDHG